MKPILNILSLAILFISAPVWGEIYQWSDDNGSIHISDDVSSVPKESKSKIKKVDDSITSTNNSRTLSTVNFKSGSYEVKNWMEIPGQGRVNHEKQIRCLTENELGWKMFKDTNCKLLSEKANGNTLSWEYSCDYAANGINGISGSITYFGDHFEGAMSYHNATNKNNLKIGLSGRRLGDCSDSKAIDNTNNFSDEKYKRGSAEFIALEKQLIDTWNQMRNELKKRRIEAALTYFLESSRASFRSQFTALQNELPKMADDMGEPRLVKVMEDSFAECDLRRVVNGQTYSFMLQYVLDTDGVWRIRTF